MCSIWGIVKAIKSFMYWQKIDKGRKSSWTIMKMTRMYIDKRKIKSLKFFQCWSKFFLVLQNIYFCLEWNSLFLSMVVIRLSCAFEWFFLTHLCGVIMLDTTRGLVELFTAMINMNKLFIYLSSFCFLIIWISLSHYPSHFLILLRRLVE
jgi:hypothetical protein